jgi:hypothetical protein
MKCQNVTSLSVRIRNIVLVLCMGVKRQGGAMRSKVYVGPVVLIHLKNTATHKLQYFQFILNNGARQTVKQSNKIIHGRKKKY